MCKLYGFLVGWLREFRSYGKIVFYKIIIKRYRFLKNGWLYKDGIRNLKMSLKYVILKVGSVRFVGIVCNFILFLFGCMWSSRWVVYKFEVSIG